MKNSKRIALSFIGALIVLMLIVAVVWGLVWLVETFGGYAFLVVIGVVIGIGAFGFFYDAIGDEAGDL